MLYLPYAAEDVLEDALDAMFYIQGYAPEHRIERLIPDAKISLVIELDDQERHVYDNETLQPNQSCMQAWFSGMHTGFISISALENTELLAIQFKPGKAYPFIDKPLDLYLNKVVPATELFGDSIVNLRDKIRESADPEQKLNMAAQWLMDRFEPALAPPHPISTAINQIVTHPVLPTLKDILNQQDYSKKHFLYLFKKYVGLSPKSLQRILRFAEVLRLIQSEEHISWAQISVDCGYYDQSHFIKDFLHFSGYNPKEFLDEDHERPNFFPVDG